MKAADLVIFEMNASQYILTKDNKSCNVFLAKFLPEKKNNFFWKEYYRKMYETTWHVSCAVQLLDSALATE